MTSDLVFHGDCRQELVRLRDAGVQVHACVTDPPYGLGFMGKHWDSTSIERDPEFWKLVLDLLLPGGYCVAFSAARTGHWQACAMEQAGFVMHPMIGWVTGQGFPKAVNVSKAIDRELGFERQVIAQVRVKGGGTEQINRKNAATHDYRPSDYQKGENVLDITASASAEAQRWEGWAYGTQSLKPAMEPIYVAQKPFSEKNGALNILKHGVGAVNIDGCRVAYMSDADQASAKPGGRATSKVGALAGGIQNDNERNDFVPDNTKGRHPANLIHDGSDDVVALFPSSAGQQAALTGFEPSSKTGTIYGEFASRGPSEPRKDSGSAARFFNSFPPLIYQPKAGKEDRAGSSHPTVKPVALIQHLCRLVTPPGGTVLDPFAGTGTTGVAAIAEGFTPVLIERETEYVEVIRARLTAACAELGRA